MGSYEGHALPGSIFFLLSGWWFLNILVTYTKLLRINGAASSGASPASFKSTTWFPIPCSRLHKIPCEPFVKIFFCILGICLELFPKNAWILIAKTGEFREASLNNYAHSAMFAFFLFAGVLECLQFWKVLSLPKEVEHVVLAFAFFVEGLLFYFHLDGRSVIDKRLHSLLYLVVFITSIVLLLEAWMKNSFLLLVVRGYLTMLQGTWFFQIAHSLYGNKPWKDTIPNREFVTIVFTWHALILLFVWLVLFVLVSVKVRGCCAPNYLAQNNNVQTAITLTEVEDPERSSLIDSEE